MVHHMFFPHLKINFGCPCQGCCCTSAVFGTPPCPTSKDLPYVSDQRAIPEDFELNDWICALQSSGFPLNSATATANGMTSLF